MLLVKQQDNSFKQHAYSQGIWVCLECHASKMQLHHSLCIGLCHFSDRRHQSTPCIVWLFHWSIHSTCVQSTHPSESSHKMHLQQYHRHWLQGPLKAWHQALWSPIHSNQDYLSWKRDTARQQTLWYHRVLCWHTKITEIAYAVVVFIACYCCHFHCMLLLLLCAAMVVVVACYCCHYCCAAVFIAYCCCHFCCMLLLLLHAAVVVACCCCHCVLLFEVVNGKVVAVVIMLFLEDTFLEDKSHKW